MISLLILKIERSLKSIKNNKESNIMNNNLKILRMPRRRKKTKEREKIPQKNRLFQVNNRSLQKKVQSKLTSHNIKLHSKKEKIIQRYKK